MWNDLAADIAKLFGDVRLERGHAIVQRPHHTLSRESEDDAARWLKASESEREAMAGKYESALEVFRLRCAQALVRTPRVAKPRPAEVQRERMREYRASSPQARTADAKRSQAWRQKNRARAAEYLRTWRKNRATA